MKHVLRQQVMQSQGKFLKGLKSSQANVVNDHIFLFILDHERNCQASHGNEGVLQPGQTR